MFRNSESNMHIFKTGSSWVSYLEELKQHVIKVRWHINNRYWMTRLLHCTEGKKEEVFIPSTSFTIHYSNHSWMISISGNYSAALWFYAL